MDRDFGNWLDGFIDGEGCFVIREVNKNGMVYCGFSIELRLDDAEILREIHRRLGIGHLKMRHRTGKKGNDRPQIGWVIQDGKGCLVLAKILEAHPLRAKKRRDFAIWRLALHEQLTNRSRRKGEDRSAHAQRMIDYREALIETRQYDGGDVVLPAPTPPQLRLIS